MVDNWTMGARCKSPPKLREVVFTAREFNTPQSQGAAAHSSWLDPIAFKYSITRNHAIYLPHCWVCYVCSCGIFVAFRVGEQASGSTTPFIDPITSEIPTQGNSFSSRPSASIFSGCSTFPEALLQGYPGPRAALRRGDCADGPGISWTLLPSRTTPLLNTFVSAL